VLASLTEAHAQERVSQMTNSQKTVATQTPRMGDIIKVVNPEDGLAGMVGEVKHFGDDGLVGVEFPGWGDGHTLDCLDEPDGWYFSDNELEVLSEE
jgi:hypothetical protein